MLPHEHIAISTIALPTAAALIGRRHAALFWIGAAGTCPAEVKTPETQVCASMPALPARQARS